MTKKYKNLSVIFFILSTFVTFFPVIFYTIKGFLNGSPVQKLSLGMLVTAALIIVIVNFLFKANLRCIIWILLLGIYICLDNIIPLILMVTIGTILDELVFTPLHKRYKNLYIINKEIDKRL